jgi:hypothetical protein
VDFPASYIFEVLNPHITALMDFGVLELDDA